MRSRNKTIAISMGDPCGIGPEVIVKALRQIKSPVIIAGDYSVYQFYGGKIDKNIEFVHIPAFKDYKKSIGHFSRESGAASLSYLQKAIKLICSNKASALVTAPLSKEAVALTYPRFSGHTEYLAHIFGAKHVDMMFVASDIKTVIVTRHIPLKDVPRELSSQKVFQSIRLTHTALKKLFRIRSPRIGVCGLNPHAGEGGLLGTEDQQKIAPALAQARRLKIKVDGPLPADTIFTKKLREKFDAILAMYHDQGLAPVKALYFDKLVNLTIGLPIVRTCPAHGTAFDIAGRNKADPGSMIESIRLAAQLAS